MKISIEAATNMRDILEHTKTIMLGVQADTTHIIWDSPYGIPEEFESKAHVNNCAGAAKLMRDKEILEQFKKGFGIVQGTPAFYLYGFLSEKGLGQTIEISAKHRLFVGECGPVVPFIQNTALACGSEIYDAVPSLRELVSGLQSISYKGEILFGCTESFEICYVGFGHQVAAFSLFCELSKQHPQAFFEYAFGLADAYELHTDRIAINTLLSYPPYPYTDEAPFSILAPTGSEKHLYRFKQNQCEVAYVATWGLYIQEAKRRCRRTIESCRNYYDLLQYRIDYGYKDKFYIMSDTYARLGG